jgi:serine phosphatase RsbU (regulator of sigma subunit)
MASGPGRAGALANLRLHELATAASWRSVTSRRVGRQRPAHLLAGQPPPLKLSADGSVCELEMPPHRLPLGAMTRGRHSLLCVPVAAGELVLAYSDGVVEARSPAGEMFGEERLRGVLAAGPPVPEQVLGRVLGALDEFTQNTEPYDDLTLLAVSRRAVEA